MKCYENATDRKANTMYSGTALIYPPKMCHEGEFKCKCLFAELQQAVSVMRTFYTVVLKVVSKGPSYRDNFQLL